MNCLRIVVRARIRRTKFHFPIRKRRFAIIPFAVSIVVVKLCNNYVRIFNIDGTTTFEGVKPGVLHTLSETQQEDWTLSGIYCDAKSERPVILEDTVEEQVKNAYAVYVPRGETEVNCYVGNYRDAELTLAKSNDQVGDGAPGDIVTYTLVVEVPKDSDELFDAQVVDLPPESFEVVNGSATATTNMPSHNIAGDVGSGPNYASPGTWNLGNLVPGEVVTLTYQAEIKQSTTSGEYPDLAYALAYDDPANTMVVFANGDTPFVATAANVVNPTEVLINTGSGLLLAQVVIPVMAMLTVLGLRPRQKKGGRA